MPRYIDADALTENLLSYADANKGTYHAEGFKNAITVVEDQPTADVVKVVRCKDCNHRIFDHGFYACDLDSWDFHEHGRNAEDDNWFCADGEKKEITGKAGEKGENRI